MYAHIDAFPIDKARNVIVEEGIAPLYVREFWRKQGKKVNSVRKHMADDAGSKWYDLVDALGVTWEVKWDTIWHTTGNVYVELQALESSKADKYLIFAGLAYVIAKSELWKAIEGWQAKRGGDGMRSLGVPLPIEVLEEYAEEVLWL